MMVDIYYSGLGWQSHAKHPEQLTDDGSVRLRCGKIIRAGSIDRFPAHVGEPGCATCTQSLRRDTSDARATAPTVSALQPSE